jgi:transcriptional regulator with XRE-family HTH domain
VNTLGSRLRKARERKRISQTRVFELIGINNKTLSRYENDGTEPDAKTLKALADLYHVSLDWIYGRNEKERAEYTLSESEYERMITEAEVEYKVNLRDDPNVEGAVRELIWRLAQMKQK